MNYKNLKDNEITSTLKKAVGEERDKTTEVLHLLREADRRQTYAQEGYASLFEYAVKEFKYSAGAATRRLEAMRLIRDLPEVEDKIVSGELSLCVVAQAQHFFKAEKKRAKTINVESKREILKTLENKSTREAERELVKLSPELPKPEKLRAVSETLTEVRSYWNDRQLNKAKRLKELLSNKKANMSMVDLIEEAMDIALEKLEPKEDSTPALESNRTTTPKAKRYVFTRDKGQCVYMDPNTKRRCNSRHQLEIDHIQPTSLGGTNSAENLRLYCRTHNILAATQKLGHQHMRKFVPSLR